MSFSAAAGEPLGVENAGGEPVVIEFAASIPPLQDIAEGYDALPQAGWVRLDGETGRALEPGRSAKTNIVVRVPKDEGLVDGQYAFDCLVKGRNAAGSAVTLKTRLSFAVGDGDASADESEPPEDFEVSPHAGRMDAVPLGKRFELYNEAFRGLKLVNAGSREMKVRLATQRGWPEGLRPPEGFVPAPNPRWLKTGPAVRVPPGAITTAPLRLLIPAQARYAGRSWSFLLALDVDDGAAQGRRWFVMSVTTKSDQDLENRLKQ